MLGNFGFALVLLFILMAVMFRSVLDSFYRIVALPLATVGGMAALQIINIFTFTPLDLLAMIGFIILTGLVVNNAILLVDQTREASARAVGARCRRAGGALPHPADPRRNHDQSRHGADDDFMGEGGGDLSRPRHAIAGGMAVSTLFTSSCCPRCCASAGRRTPPDLRPPLAPPALPHPAE